MTPNPKYYSITTVRERAEMPATYGRLQASFLRLWVVARVQLAEEVFVTCMHRAAIKFARSAIHTLSQGRRPTPPPASAAAPRPQRS